MYDHSGEADYTDLVRDTLTLVFGPADSAELVFDEFFYETDWDSLFIYDGHSTAAPLIGGYTGAGLPNGGLPIKLSSSAVTIEHFSDPFVHELGFKAFLEVFRPPILLQHSNDTSACIGETINLSASLSGGNPADHAYWWNGVKGDSTFSLVVYQDTVIQLMAGDECTGDFVQDSIVISLRDSLKLANYPDTTVCHNQALNFLGMASGGDPSNYQYRWLPSGELTANLSLQLTRDTSIGLIVEDGCTEFADTTTFNIIVRDPFSWIQSADTTICQGTSGRFEVNIIDGGRRPMWFFSSIISDSSQGVIAQPSYWMQPGANLGPGSYDYWISWSDHCTEHNDTAHWTLTVLDTLELVVSADTSICFGTEAVLSASISGGRNSSYEFQWDQGLADQSSHTVNPSNTTTYHVIASDGCSAIEPKDSILVTVLEPLSVLIAGDTDLCYKELETFNALAAGGVPSSYSFSWNDGEGTGLSFSRAFEQDSVLKLVLSDGCSAENDSTVVQILVGPPLELDLTPDLSICEGETVNLSAQASGGLGSYFIMWNLGEAFGPNYSVSPNQTTSYAVVLRDNCSEEVNGAVQVTVNPMPVADFSLQPDSQCTGLDVDFTNRGSSGPGLNFFWDFGDAMSSTMENPSHPYQTAGDYDVKFRIRTDSGCADSMEMQQAVAIVAHPIASFTANPLVANFFDPDFNFNNQSSNASRYFWSFGDGTSSSSTSPSHSYADTGRYEVRLEASNSLGCIDADTLTVTVQDVVVLHVPSAFSPNQDGNNDEFGMFARGIASFELLVFNRWGEILWQTNNVHDRWDGKFLDEPLPGGIYFYKLYATDIYGKTIEDTGELHVLY